MSITIDWGTSTIHVPKSYMTLVQSVPSEIYQLDLNQFRLTLKSLEDTDDGMAFLRTHKHNTEVEVSGVTLARVVEIINGYTITFEDDQYRVNAVGANSNIGDVVNVNQVSISTANSAGLITVSGGTSLTAQDVWDYPMNNIQNDPATIGGYIKTQVINVAKWIGLSE
jgi:hypothetical protein